MGLFTFDPETHCYRLEGQVIPGVTSILKETGLAPIYPGHSEAAYVGMHVHMACEALDLHDDAFEVHPDCRGYVQAWRAFKDAQRFEPELIEAQLFREDLRLAGTLDRVGMLAGTRTLIDVKTGQPEAWHPLQCAAYAILLNEPTIQRVLVYLHDDGRYAMTRCNDMNDFKIVLSAISITHWKRAHSNGRSP